MGRRVNEVARERVNEAARERVNEAAAWTTSCVLEHFSRSDSGATQEVVAHDELGKPGWGVPTWLSLLSSRDNFGSVILITAPFSMRRVAETSGSVLRLRCRGLTQGVHCTRRPRLGGRTRRDHRTAGTCMLYLSFSFNLSQ